MEGTTEGNWSNYKCRVTSTSCNAVYTVDALRNPMAGSLWLVKINVMLGLILQPMAQAIGCNIKPSHFTNHKLLVTAFR